ncbi:MAG TPA: hypothetical protein VKV02_01500, partial [Acidobacteriaceae bacterium]|nr:hypothetical protein [Acidobacteriaceae bacterium]
MTPTNEAMQIARQAVATVEAEQALENARLDHEAFDLSAASDAYLEQMWQARRDVPSLLARIREVTGGRMMRPAQDVRGDFRDYVPPHYLRASGMASDEVAEALGFDNDGDLLEALRNQPALTTATAKEAFRPRADEAARRDLEALQEAILDAEASAQVAREALEALAGHRVAQVALIAARAGRDVEKLAWLVMAAQGVSFVQPEERRVTIEPEPQTWTPRRECRRPDAIAMARDLARRMAQDVREGAHVAAGMVMCFWVDWARDARQRI